MSKENRLIDANALELAKFTVTQESEYVRGWNDALNAVRINALTADVVEVVRCKDCKFYQSYGRTSLLVDGKNIKAGWCNRRIRYDEEYRMLPDDFCSYGERREDA